jgi:hypothetical protein
MLFYTTIKQVLMGFQPFRTSSIVVSIKKIIFFIFIED